MLDTFITTRQKDYQNVILEKADLIITVGYDIVEFAPIKWNLKDDHKIIHIDSRPSAISDPLWVRRIFWYLMLEPIRCGYPDIITAMSQIPV